MKNTVLKFGFLVVASFGLMGCAGDGYRSEYGEYDPFEGFNRSVYAFNDAVNEAVIYPGIRGYRYVTPSFFRTGLQNFLRNLSSPVTFANQLLQGDLEGAGDVLLRASINTFVGGVGLWDVAGYEGIEYEAEDFGQTLAVWGVDHGPYIVVPFFGGASLRDLTGLAVDTVIDPVNLYLANVDEDPLLYVRAGLTYLNLRDSLYDPITDLERNSIDPYAAIRSAYYQHRNALVRDMDDSNYDDNQIVGFDEFY